MSEYLKRIINRVEGDLISTKSVIVPDNSMEGNLLDSDPFEDISIGQDHANEIIENEPKNHTHRFIDLISPMSDQSRTINPKPKDDMENELKNPFPNDRIAPNLPIENERKPIHLSPLDKSGVLEKNKENVKDQNQIALKKESEQLIFPKDPFEVFTPDKKSPIQEGKKELIKLQKNDKEQIDLSDIIRPLTVDMKNNRTANLEDLSIETNEQPSEPTLKKIEQNKGLVIGNLNVEIVTPRVGMKTNSKKRNTKKSPLPRARIKGSHFGSKAKFGLGQL